MATDFQGLLQRVAQHEVRFIVVGGLAATIHGSARLTFDVDIVYARALDNLRRLVEALRPYSPYLRGAPAGLPFTFDERTLRMGLNFTLVTSLGDVDLIGEIAGGGTYDQLLPHSAEVEAFGTRFQCVGLETLIQLKRAAGRPKDLESIAELQAILEERRKASQPSRKQNLNL